MVYSAKHKSFTTFVAKYNKNIREVSYFIASLSILIILVINFLLSSTIYNSFSESTNYAVF